MTTVDKILNKLDVAKVFGIDQVFEKFLKGVVLVAAINLANIINLLIKLDTFPLKCKIAKIQPLFKKGVKTETKSYKPISLSKKIQDQIQDYPQRINRCAFTN